MSSLSSVGRFAAAHNKDRKSLCRFTFADGIVSVARGDIKPRSARTLAYLAQTLVQTIHLAPDEYINAFDTDGWRRAVRNSVKGNHDYLFSPAPKPSQDHNGSVGTRPDRPCLEAPDPLGTRSGGR